MSLFNSRESGFFSGGGGANGVNGNGTQFFVPIWNGSSSISDSILKDKNSGADNLISILFSDSLEYEMLRVNFAISNKYVSFGSPNYLGGLRTTSAKLTILGDIKTTT
jgi:hypothetical protein